MSPRLARTFVPEFSLGAPPGCIEVGGFTQCDLEDRACIQGAVNCRPSGCIRWEES